MLLTSSLLPLSAIWPGESDGAPRRFNIALACCPRLSKDQGERQALDPPPSFAPQETTFPSSTS